MNQPVLKPSAQTEPATFDDLYSARVKRKWLAEGSNSFSVVASYPCLTSIVNATHAHSLHRPHRRCVYGPIADIVILAISMVQLVALFSDRTSATPSHGCRAGTLDES
jgi:hypothetical protein